jgi:DNA-binding CsgD family transcriptional regulator
MNAGIKATFSGNEEDKGLLTPAEWKVFLYHCEGWSKKQIADFVCRSPDTVKTKEEAIRRKSGVHSMTQAVLKAIAKGIVTISALCLMVFVSTASFYVSDIDTPDIRRQTTRLRVRRKDVV